MFVYQRLHGDDRVRLRVGIHFGILLRLYVFVTVLKTKNCDYEENTIAYYMYI